jgi:ABC-type uncharacterized transport system permease subunit
MSEAFEAKMVGITAAIFLVAVTVWVLHSHYILNVFEAALGVALSIIVAAFISVRLIKSDYTDFLEENPA